ncbi:MAG: prolyl oligopeptidase family serine peptidase, partial [Chitinophagaceae bacterium]
QNKFPTQENDIKSALTTFMSKTGDYNISRDVVLLGASAGAHLALLQAYKYTDPVKVKAVVSFFGPTDIADMYNSPAYPQVPELLQLLLGGTPTSDPEVYRQSSPISFVTTETCPTLIFQGGKDLLVNPRQATILEDTLKKAGVITELIIYPDEGHGWRGLSLGDSFEKIGDFLKENVE